MDCRTAQLLLPFLRPGGHDLGPADRSALDAHLDHCPHCGPLAQSQTRFDDIVGRAMLAVQPPVEFRHRVLQRLAADRRAVYRRQLVRGGLAAALVAALAFGAWELREWSRPTVGASELIARADDLRGGQSDEERIVKVEKFFRDNGAPVVAPRFLDYQGLVSYSFADLKGRSVPTLMFLGRNNAVAVVHILDNRQFNLKNISDLSQVSSGAEVVIHFDNEQERKYAYVVEIFGGTEADFKRPEGQIAQRV
jgi:hypothetical protein